MPRSLSRAQPAGWRSQINPDIKQALKRISGVHEFAQWTWHRKLAQDRRVARTPQRVRSQVEEYLEQARQPRLQIGAGPFSLEGWLNVDYEPESEDVVYLDATQPFPLPDSTFTHIFSEHVIEHVPYSAGLHMLTECYRVLCPGGRIRVATPNLTQLVGLFQEPKTETQVRYLDKAIPKYFEEPRVHNECFFLNRFLHAWGHQFVYDEATLANTLEKAGFRQVAVCAIGVSDDPNFAGCEMHAGGNRDELNVFETMVLEARKA